ncbi:hypothetical protein DFH08DRAFT_1019877 [Mycena albidolilacea]|uniref:Uncharacterized protein n=1 Tax=Mycena albidolilacea TaxID=1033008 RepID=A0AAD7EKA7_9AGAR|nr:hypothetical protein DFH08DRAFT_1019877 [Mycena albidolilacea]
MSVSKTYCTAFGIHPVPANTTTEDFQAKCEALVESFLALPVAQQNFLKFDILFQNHEPEVKSYTTALGFPESPPCVCLRCYYEVNTFTDANWAACLQDPDFINTMAAGRSWGFYDGACIFSADSVTVLDSKVPSDTNVVIGIFKSPAQQTASTFRQKLDTLIDTVLDLKKPTVNVTMLVQNPNAEQNLQAAGYPSSQPATVVVSEWKTFDEIAKISNDIGAQNLIAQAMKAFDFQINSAVFSADVKNKFTRPTA